MRIPAFIFGGLLLLAACSAEPAVPRAPDWVGQSKAGLLSALGEPKDRMPVLGGGEILAYEEKEEIKLPAPTRLSGSDYQQSGAFSERPRTVIVTCVREYEAGADGIIKSVKTRSGTGCLD